MLIRNTLLNMTKPRLLSQSSITRLLRVSARPTSTTLHVANQPLTQIKPTKKAIGILGGTFSPPTIAHRELANTVMTSLDLSAVHLMPVHVAPHKKNIVSAEHRKNMVELAIKGQPNLKIDLVEYERQEPSITADTIKILRERYKDTPLCFIIGMDSLSTFTTWDRWEEIIDNAHLVVVDRPGYPLPKAGDVATLLSKRLNKTPSSIHDSLGGSIVMCPIQLDLDISSTAIRNIYAAGKKPHGLIADEVINYIDKHGLYQTQTHASLFTKTPTPPKSTALVTISPAAQAIVPVL